MIIASYSTVLSPYLEDSPPAAPGIVTFTLYMTTFIMKA